VKEGRKSTTIREYQAQATDPKLGRGGCRPPAHSTNPRYHTVRELEKALLPAAIKTRTASST